MPSIRRTPEARHDLSEIIATIAAANYSAALKWIDDMEAVFQLLSSQPRMGERFRSRKRAEVRRHCRGNYVIYYRPLDDGIEIYRVLHGARDHERLI